MRILKVLVTIVVIATVYYLFPLVWYDESSLPKIVLVNQIENAEVTKLTTLGVVRISNLERDTYGLNPLIKNEKLSLAAEMKVDDMLKNQYFAHVSPSGDEASDLVESTGYSFIAVGENLATGDFKDDKNLVSGWMNSPGHRKNILHPGYLEIGVAVGRGIFEGREVWMAVQIFALPDHACPKPDQNLFAVISSNKEQLSSIRQDLEELERGVGLMIPGEGNKILEYNTAVYEYNSLLERTMEMIRDYNLQIQLRNECISSYGF